MMPLDSFFEHLELTAIFQNTLQFFSESTIDRRAKQARLLAPQIGQHHVKNRCPLGSILCGDRHSFRKQTELRSGGHWPVPFRMLSSMSPLDLRTDMIWSDESD